MSGADYYPNAVYQKDKPQAPVQTAVASTVQGTAEQTVSGPNGTENTSRECSIRSCTNPVDSSNKMCSPCREKHRLYSSSKRARRKAEKDLVSRLSGSGAAPKADAWMNQATSSTAAAQYSPLSTLSTAPESQAQQAPTAWIHAIDPRLYSDGPSTSSSSTLAGALTLQPSTRSLPDGSSDQAGKQVTVSSNMPPRQEEPRPGVVVGQSTEPGFSAATNTMPAASGSGATDAAETTGADALPPRWCSVKGCKAIIYESTSVYPYKMCQPCRSRYRLYGITKRAKWKAEREAYDRELEGLRIQEDARRAANGLPPLSDSPEELQAWEISIIDEEVPLPPSLPASSGAGPSTQKAYVPVPMNPPDSRYSHAAFPADVPLPARMCTVSHCHQILPGFYRYKRCEAHRTQNRWHSQLKRGREKVEKGFILPDGTPVVTPGPLRVKKSAENKDKQPRKKKAPKTKDNDAEGAEGQVELATEANSIVPAEGGSEPIADGADDDPSNAPSKEHVPQKRPLKSSKSTCREDDCCNLLLPGTRWRGCESCRTRIRVYKREKKAAERNPVDAATFVNMTMNIDKPEDGPITSITTTAAVAVSGASTAITPVDITPRVASPTIPAPTSTLALLTFDASVDNPPRSEAVDNSNKDIPTAKPPITLVRKYRKWAPPKSAKFVEDADSDGGASGNTVTRASGITPTQASQKSKTKPTTSSAPINTQPPPLITTAQSSPYPYPYPTPSFPAPPGTIPYYIPPGYIPQPPLVPGQPPLLYPYPYAMMPPNAGTSQSPAPGQPPLPYPYYPYTLPQLGGYGLHQHPYAQYAYASSPPSQPPSQYAMYKAQSKAQAAPPPSLPAPPPPAQIPVPPLSTPSQSVPVPPPPPPPPGTGPSQGYTYYHFKNGLKPEVSKKRKWDGELEWVEPEIARPSPFVETISPPVSVAAEAPVPLPKAAQPIAAVAATKDQEEPASTTTNAPLCTGKTCRRPLAIGTAGLCEKCRAKLKKRQALTKQRFKLEPKAAIKAAGRVSDET